jgi:hypothetical protein
MNEMKKTIWFAGVAIVLVLMAVLLAPKRITPEAFLDQGQVFYPQFTDPNIATTLEVISFDESAGTASPFKVTFKNNQWTIPSHNNYPADAKDRLAKTAAGLIEIKKDDFRTANVSDHAECGVIDPLDEGTVGLSGRGTRVTVRDAGDQVLADFVIGKPVPGRQGFRFVRIPGQNRVYACKTDVDLSTRFADWIDTDLLRAPRNKIDGITLDNYSINERTRSVVKGDVIALKHGDNGWVLTNQKGSGDLDTTKIKSLAGAVSSLSIVGVRPKPEGLAGILSGDPGQHEISQTDQVSLQSKGFYLDRQGRLLSNEGEMRVHTSDGIAYTLRFGEVLYGSGLSVTAGVEEQVTPADRQTGAANRYLFVTAEFDENSLKMPPSPRSTDFKNKPDSLLTDDDRANKQMQTAVDAWRRKVDEGRKLAADLNARFADWYYVISSDSFDKIHVTRDELREKGKS